MGQVNLSITDDNTFNASLYTFTLTERRLASSPDGPYVTTVKHENTIMGKLSGGN